MKQNMIIGLGIAIICILAVIIYVETNGCKCTPNEEPNEEIGEINIDKLQAECGSTYITKCSDEWCVFKSVCKSDGYCKYSDVKIKDCYT